MSIVKPDVLTVFPVPTSAVDIVPVPESDNVSDPARFEKLVRLLDATFVVPSYVFVPETVVDLGTIVIVSVPFVKV